MLWFSGLLILSLSFILFAPAGAHGTDQFAWFASALLVFLLLSERLCRQASSPAVSADDSLKAATGEMIAQALTDQLHAEKEMLEKRVRQLEAENADLRRFVAEAASGERKAQRGEEPLSEAGTSAAESASETEDSGEAPVPNSCLPPAAEGSSTEESAAESAALRPTQSEVPAPSCPLSARDSAWGKAIVDLEKGLKRRMPKKCRAALDLLTAHPAAADAKDELAQLERIVKRCEFAEGLPLLERLR